ncbi:hypothetical protein BB560_002651 [Smittium megazygosporum]|uniref:Protein kinase domain-containing protein n=1 Tax=Smittium megazygosporum TaxID=133381 RepID=A0A2T9ZEA8_9FUNG|nr:hypothetical protein BB560_002651 [Smittium megazygosporum]
MLEIVDIQTKLHTNEQRKKSRVDSLFQGSFELFDSEITKYNVAKTSDSEYRSRQKNWKSGNKENRSKALEAYDRDFSSKDKTKEKLAPALSSDIQENYFKDVKNSRNAVQKAISIPKKFSGNTNFLAKDQVGSFIHNNNSINHSDIKLNSTKKVLKIKLDGGNITPSQPTRKTATVTAKDPKIRIKLAPRNSSIPQSKRENEDNIYIEEIPTKNKPDCPVLEQSVKNEATDFIQLNQSNNSKNNENYYQSSSSGHQRSRFRRRCRKKVSHTLSPDSGYDSGCNIMNNAKQSREMNAKHDFEFPKNLNSKFDFIFNTPLAEYRLIKHLGSGSYGSVDLMENIVSNQRYAVKKVYRLKSFQDRAMTRDRLRKMERRVINEGNMANLLGQIHPHIAMLYDIRKSKTFFYMFFEHIRGPTLAEVVGERGLPEIETKYLFRQMVHTVKFLHSYCITHRDIKLDNIMVDYKCLTKEYNKSCNCKTYVCEHLNYGKIKFIDFGLSGFWNGNKKLSTFCGSPPYTAPEIFRGTPYRGAKVDIWSLGICLYVMKSGRFPFSNSKSSNDIEIIEIPLYKMPENISPELENLIQTIIEPDPEKRPSASTILKHEWFEIGECNNAKTKIGPDKDENDEYCCASCLGGNKNLNKVSTELLKIRNMNKCTIINREAIKKVSKLLSISESVVYKEVARIVVGNNISQGLKIEKPGGSYFNTEFKSNLIVSIYILFTSSLEIRRESSHFPEQLGERFAQALQTEKKLIKEPESVSKKISKQYNSIQAK